MNDVAAIPTAAKAKPMRSAPGSVSRISGDRASPNTTITARNPIEYRAPRMSAHASSPREMSAGDIGVVRIDANVLS